MSPADTSKDSEQKNLVTPQIHKARGTYRRNRRRGDIQSQSSSPAWLVSFTDIMALMLTFFVLLYSMSEPEEKSWSQIIAALRSELHSHYGPRFDQSSENTINLDRLDQNRALNLDYLHSLLEDLMLDRIEKNALSLHVFNQHLVISLPEEIFFESGTASVQEEGNQVLHTLGNILSRIRNRIEIVGHTDPDPITNPQSSYPSNWELSLQRAAAVAEVLHKNGYRRPLSMRGGASVQYTHTAPGSSNDTRKDLSRRVDIHIMKDDGQQAQESRINLR